MSFIKNLLTKTSTNIKVHILDQNFKLPTKYIIDVDNDYKVLDIKNGKDEIQRLQTLKDLIFLFEDFKDFDFEILKKHQVIQKDIEYLKNNYEKIYHDGIKDRKGTKEINYHLYATLRYKIILLIESANYYIGIENKELLMAPITNFSLSKGSMNLSNDIMCMLKENDNIVQSTNTKKELFCFAHKKFIYLPMAGAHTKTKEIYKNQYKKYVIEYYKTIKEEDRTQSNMINLLRLKKVSNIGDIEDYADTLKSSILQSIKDDIKQNLPQNINEAREYLEDYLFYKFHIDITVFIDELLNTIDDILKKEDEVSLALNQKRLYGAEELADELKELYTQTPQYEDKTILNDVEDRLNTYKSKISNASTYQEFQDAKTLCIDDKDIEQKEQNLINSILEDIKSSFTENVKENLSSLKSKLQNQPRVIVEYFKDIKKEFTDTLANQRIDECEKIINIDEKIKFIDTTIDEFKLLDTSYQELVSKQQDIQNIINSIDIKAQDIDSLIESKKLFEALEKAEIFKNNYENITDKTNTTYEYANKKLDIYNSSISVAKSIQEFQSAKNLCIDDKDIKTKEDQFYSAILKDINSIDDVALRYEKLGISSRFDEYRKELLREYGLKTIDKFYIDGVECIRKDTPSFLIH
ncbi:MAG: hypothetical protein U9N59_01785, partial [Campylobacterota bacterium]|nr:hypothetical protein [Campylobacterota bacterium]